VEISWFYWRGKGKVKRRGGEGELESGGGGEWGRGERGRKNKLLLAFIATN
jgi:hypothetical protein